MLKNKTMLAFTTRLPLAVMIVMGIKPHDTILLKLMSGELNISEVTI